LRKATSRLREALETSLHHTVLASSPDLAALQRRVVQTYAAETPPPTLDANVEGPAFALLGRKAGSRDYNHWDVFVKYWISTAGAPFALRALAEATRYTRGYVESDRGVDTCWLVAAKYDQRGYDATEKVYEEGWETLQEWTAAAADDAYKELFQTTPSGSTTLLSLRRSRRAPVVTGFRGRC
jgi:hypothetical protein